MAFKNERDIMNVNLSNVFTPSKSTHHMSEDVYDVDFTSFGDAPMENHEDIRLGEFLKQKLNILDEEETNK